MCICKGLGVLLYLERGLVDADVSSLEAVCIRLMVLSRATRTTGGHYEVQLPRILVAPLPTL